MKTSAILASIILAGVASPAFCAPLSLGAGKIATISDTIQSSGPPVINTTIGAAVTVGGVQSSSGTAQAVPNAAATLQLPGSPPSGTLYSSTSTAIADVSQYISYAIGNIAHAIAYQMTQGVLLGAKLTAFNYSVPVTIQSRAGSTNGFVNDTCLIQPNGADQCLGATYNSNLIKIIYATYQQGAVAQGLPQSWQLPNPGELRWALLEVQRSGASSSSNFVTVGGQVWHTIHLLRAGGVLGQYGLYDMYQTGKISNQSVLINCGASNDSQCTHYQAGTDVPDPSSANQGAGLSYNQQDPVNLLAQNEIVPLIKQFGASSGILLYGEMVQPVYTQDACQTINGQQVCQDSAETAIYISQRVVLTGNNTFFFIFTGGGNGKFQEQGQYGYLLNESVQQYEVLPTGATRLLNTDQQHEISPTQSFMKSVSLNGTTISATDVINPFPSGNQIYSWEDDTINHLPASAYIYVAPLISK